MSSNLGQAAEATGDVGAGDGVHRDSWLIIVRRGGGSPQREEELCASHLL